MRTLVVKRNVIMSIFTLILLTYSAQGISYGQLDAPTFASGENNMSLVVKFRITLDEGVDENAYQIQLRRKTPPGEWISKCVVIERGIKRSASYNSQGGTGEPDVFVSSVWNSGGWFTSGSYSTKTFNIKVIFTDLEIGTTYEARYRDTNLPECTQNPPAPDPWSDVGEGTTFDVITAPGGRTSLYFIDDHFFHQVNFDGTYNSLTDLANLGGTTSTDIIDIALDIAGGKIYWTEFNSRWIRRANLDGSNAEAVIESRSSSDTPRYIAVDAAGGKIYWNIRGGSIDYILSANLDGTNVQYFGGSWTFRAVIGLERASGLDIAGGKLYWTDWETNKIKRVDLDGTDIQNILNVRRPSDIVVDVAGGKMYWVEQDNHRIRRANLDGTDIQNILNGLETPSDIALDIPHGKIYWTDRGTDKIQRANLDGTNVQDVVIGLSNLRAIALNPFTGSRVSLTTSVSLSPSTVQPPVVGEQLTFSLNIAGGEAVAGYQATVKFDDTALRFVSSANGDYLPAGAFFVEPVVEGNHVKLNAASLAGESNGDGTLATLTFEVIAVKASTLALSDVLLTNSAGETVVPQIENAEIAESIVLKGDVNGDGTVNITDLVLVASNLGETGQNAADVNGDRVVDIADLVLVAGALGTTTAAPSLHPKTLEMLTAADVKQWLSEAQQLDLTDTASQRGISFLQQLLETLTPKKTALLANYPNPFNPETWIPYQLAKPAEVNITIHAINGQVVRRLDLGHQAAGMYQNRSRAAYWDGTNAFGEPVASGVYFYTIAAGDFTATRKMLIRK